MSHRHTCCSFCLALLVTLLVAGGVVAQEAAPAPSLSIGGMGAGVGKFRDGQWGLVHVTVRNPGDQTRDLLTVLSADRMADVQFARPMLMPPATIRRTWLPLRVPDGEDPASRSVSATGRLIDTTAGANENLLSQEPVLLLHETRGVSTGMMIGDDDPDGTAANDSADVATAAQLASNVGKAISALRPTTLPPIASGYGALDTLLVARELSELGPAERDALRAWVIAGGHLWIMLDRTPATDVQRLLGASWKGAIVDRLALTEFTIESADGRDKLEINVERPIDMVRLIAPNMEVIHSVRGWPASLRMDMGQGQVLVTTLGARAWIDAEKNATTPLENLSRIFFVKTDPMIARIDWQPFLGEHIGYEIVSSETVAVTLSVFCVVLLLAGLLLHRRGRLEHIGYVAVGLALITSVALVVIGTLSQDQTPQTVVSAQTLELVPGQRQAVLRGAVQIYQPPGGGEQGEAGDRLRSTTGGAAWPQAAEKAGKLLRMVWSDIDQWHWDNLQLPQGVITGVGFQTSRLLPGEARGRLSFDAQGIRGQASLGDETLRDVLIIGPSGILLPRMGDGGEFVATSGDVPAPGQFIAGAGMAGEEQRRHGMLYEQLLGNAGKAVLRSSQPLLLGWSNQVGSGIGLGDTARRIDQSLVVMPLLIERPKAGTTITIPAAMITFTVPRNNREDADEETGSKVKSNARGPRRSANRLTTVYDPKRAEWIAVSNGGSLLIRFNPPAELLPMKLTAAKMTLDIRAPQRAVRLSSPTTATDSEASELSVQSPGGELTFDITDQAGRLLTTGQGVEVIIDVSEATDILAGQPWQIRSLGMTITGTIEPN